MIRALVTGAKGFIGRNLVVHLGRRDDVEVLEFDRGHTREQLAEWIRSADVIFHLAGVNRPERVEEFDEGNTRFTELVCRLVKSLRQPPKVVMTSSIQAELDNPYGRSKRGAEEALTELHVDSGAAVSIHRLKNVFGKWCRPNYNSVAATFCHNIARDLPITISDPSHEIELVYIDDVVEALTHELLDLSSSPTGCYAEDVIPSYRISLGDLAARIRVFRDLRRSLVIPDLSQRFDQCLYGTYLTYCEAEDLRYDLDQRSDPRGTLAEFVKSEQAGQIFVSSTRPGVVRGNHFHHTKAEKFLVLHGEALIRLRLVDDGQLLEFRVRGSELSVIDIPPGFAHSIQNVGNTEMITLFWASETFDPERSDTFALSVWSDSE